MCGLRILNSQRKERPGAAQTMKERKEEARKKRYKTVNKERNSEGEREQERDEAVSHLCRLCRPWQAPHHSKTAVLMRKR